MIIPSPIRRPAPTKRVYDQRLYFTKQWARTRKGFIEDHPFCAHCLAKGIYTPAVDVDHIIELKDGGLPFDESNLQSLCKRHHRIKTIKQAHTRRSS